MNVLSLFDGMSCAQISLERAGIPVENYFASEIDNFAIQIAMKNYPNTIQIGDVKKVDINQLPKIDLLVAGSPCQGFSVAGKQLNFEDERSKLFFEFVRILKEAKPKYFILENVKMKKEWIAVISDFVGVEPIEINSALVSAQNRKRLYWTNIPNIQQPQDKGILLKDILLDDGQGTIKNKGEWKERDQKSMCLDANYWKGVDNHGQRTMILQLPRGKNNGGLHGEKSPTLTSNFWEQNNKLLVKDYIRKLDPIECERLQTVSDNYTSGVSNTQRYKMLGNGFTVDVIANILKGVFL